MLLTFFLKIDYQDPNQYTNNQYPNDQYNQQGQQQGQQQGDGLQYYNGGGYDYQNQQQYNAPPVYGNQMHQAPPQYPSQPNNNAPFDPEFWNNPTTKIGLQFGTQALSAGQSYVNQNVIAFNYFRQSLISAF